MPAELKYVLQASLLIIVAAAVIKFSILILSSDFSSTSSVESKSVDKEIIISTNIEGKNLFQSKCAICHSLYKDIPAPALIGVEERVPDQALLYAWVRNSSEILKSGNEYFNELYFRYNKFPMPAFPSLTDEELADIFDYIRTAKN